MRVPDADLRQHGLRQRSDLRASRDGDLERVRHRDEHCHGHVFVDRDLHDDVHDDIDGQSCASTNVPNSHPPNNLSPLTFDTLPFLDFYKLPHGHGYCNEHGDCHVDFDGLCHRLGHGQVRIANTHPLTHSLLTL